MEEHDEGEDYSQTDQENLGCCSVETDARVITGKEICSFAKCFALAGSVAVWDSAEMHVGVCVRSHQLEDEVAATTAFLPALRCSSALSLGVALY